jgi:osmoprotectant transport system ATP-binding protein
VSNAFRLESVTKLYSGKAAVDDLSLVVPTGRTTVLIGPSGCGKSTVFALLTGLIWPETGWISFEDKPILPEHLLGIRRRMGYVVQDGGLFPHLNGYGNASLLAQHIGWESRKIRSRIEELANLVRLPLDLLSRFPDEMSGGQRQRVSLVRALMLNPSVLLLDEPLGALDPMVRESLQEDLTAIFKDLQKTVILVTHDLSEACFFADLMVLMRKGKIVQQGRPSDFFDRPAEPFVSQFVKAQRIWSPGEEKS